MQLLKVTKFTKQLNRDFLNAGNEANLLTLGSLGTSPRTSASTTRSRNKLGPILHDRRVKFVRPTI